MFNLTDYIVLGSFALFFVLGFRKGFIRTILGPISLIIALIISWIVQKQTGNILYTTLIALFGPFLLEWIFGFILKKISKGDGDKKLSFFSRLGGAILNSAWIVVLSLIVIFLVSIIPSSFEPTAPLRENVTGSQVYQWMKKGIKEKDILKKFDIERIQKAMDDPSQKAKIEKTREYKKIMENKKVQELLSDPQVVEMIENKDYISLLRSEKMKAIVQDKELTEQFFALQKKIMEDTLKSTSR